MLNIDRTDTWRLAVGITALLTSLGVSLAVAAPPNPGDSEEGIEVLTRGPVHEAFAATVAFDPEEGLIAPRAPPAAIEELPPDQRPEGANVDWIPGYWAWDDEREDFLWVSGLWRNLPPGRDWVAGYWNPSGEGAQWTSGYWSDATSTEQEYLPEPPATAESGPNIAQPSPDYNWLPGSWTWQQNRYAWRPGYWAAGQQDWEWVPPYYQWTPGGYVYIDGYYDYPVERRGVLFSPVYFEPNVYGRRGFSYSPSLAINLSGFMNHLFLRPSYGHYYFGDYYGSNYSSGGFYPWFAYGSSGYGYDPFYARQRWQHRGDNGWADQIESDFNNRRDDAAARPPRTWREQQELQVGGKSGDPGLFVARPYNEVLQSQDNPTRYQAVDQAERERFGKRGRDVQQFQAERQKVETAASDTQPETERQPRRSKLPKSPVVAQPADQLDKADALPERQQAPEPDPQVEPRPRQRRGRSEPQGNSSAIDPQNNPQNNPQGQPADPSNTKPQGKRRGASGGTPQSAPQGNPNGSPQGERKPRSAGKPQGSSNAGQAGGSSGGSGAKPGGRSSGGGQGGTPNKPAGSSDKRPEQKPNQ